MLEKKRKETKVKKYGDKRENEIVNYVIFFLLLIFKQHDHLNCFLHVFFLILYLYFFLFLILLFVVIFAV